MATTSEMRQGLNRAYDRLRAATDDAERHGPLFLRAVAEARAAEADIEALADGLGLPVKRTEDNDRLRSVSLTVKASLRGRL